MTKLEDVLPDTVAALQTSHDKKMRIYAAHEAGATFAQMARHFEISAVRIGQHYWHARQKLGLYGTEQHFYEDNEYYEARLIRQITAPIDGYFNRREWSSYDIRKLRRFMRVVTEFRTKSDQASKGRDWMIMSSDTQPMIVRWDDASL